MTFRIITLSAAVIILSGCSSAIEVTKLNPGGPPAIGVPWNLPMTQYTVAITRQVTSCMGTLNGKVTVAVTQGKAQDPSMRYVLSSSGMWATSDITSTLGADGTSTGLNAHSEDQTAAVITNVITIAAQAAGLAGRAVGNQPEFQCKQNVSDALAKLDPVSGPSLKDLVDRDNQAVASATTRVTQLVTDAQTDPSKKYVLSLAAHDLAVKTAKLTNDQAELSANLKIVQNVQTVVWPRDSSEFVADHAFSLDPSIAANWIEWYHPNHGVHQPLNPGEKPPPLDLSPFDLSLALYRPDGANGWVVPLASAAPDIKVGVPVRVAGVGRLLVCTGKMPCPRTLAATWEPDENQSLAINPDANVLQLGQMYVLPVTGGKFKSELAAIALDANGNPTSMEIAEKTAILAAASASAASAATQIAAIPGQVAQARLARTQAEASQINAENALTQAKANAQTIGPTADANAQAALSTAQANLATAEANAAAAGPAGQLALVTAQNNLANAQATAAASLALPGAQENINVLTTQTALLNAQANEINAEAALAKAKAALGSTP